MTRQTSKAAYQAIMNNGTLSERRRNVYDMLYKHGPMSASEVCTRLGLPRDSVSPRLAELQRLSIVQDSGVKTCSITGQKVVAWDVTGSLPRGSLKTKARRRWTIAVSKTKAVAFDSKEAAKTYAKKYKSRLIEVVECKTKALRTPTATKAVAAKPTKAAKPSKAAKPTKAAKPSKAAKPTKAAKPSKAAKPKKAASWAK